jgi:hypothetical protein
MGCDCHEGKKALGQVCQTCGGDGGVVLHYTINDKVAVRFVCPHCCLRLDNQYKAALLLMSHLSGPPLGMAGKLVEEAFKAFTADYKKIFCTKLPMGWWCSREPKHEGTCAATSYDEALPPEFSAIPGITKVKE